MDGGGKGDSDQGSIFLYSNATILLFDVVDITSFLCSQAPVIDVIEIEDSPLKPSGWLIDEPSPTRGNQLSGAFNFSIVLGQFFVSNVRHIYS